MADTRRSGEKARPRLPRPQDLLPGLGLYEGGLAVGYAVLTRAPQWRAHCAELVEQAALQPRDRVLDLGCGPGISAFSMLDRVPDLAITGLDVSWTMLRFARHFQRREPRGARLTLVRADARRLPFADASFDAVTGHSFLYLLPEPGAVLAEVVRVLRPGGRVAFLEPNQHAGPDLLPPEIWAQRWADPRFVLAMGLWRGVSRAMGRMDRGRFEALFSAAGLTLVRCEETLSGLGLYGIGARPERSTGVARDR